MSITISAPTQTPVNSTATSLYSITYTGADSISLTSAMVQVNTMSGLAACSVSNVYVTGTNTRDVELNNCTDNGEVSITIDAGSAQDAEGQLAPAASADQFLLVDNTAPDAATLLSWDEGTITNAATINASWTLSASVDRSDQILDTYSDATCSTLVARDNLGSGTSSRGVDVSAVLDSDYYFRIFTVDSAGNSSGSVCSAAIKVDHVAPAALSAIAPASPYTSTTDSFTLSGSCETGATVFLSGADAQQVGCVSNAFSFTLGPVVDGTYTYSLYQQDQATNASGTTGYQWTVDTQGPALSIGAPSLTLVNQMGSVAFEITYAGADTVTLAPADVGITGANTGCTVEVSGTGTTARTVTVSNCSGDGSAEISIAAGTASDNSGNTAPAAGPSSPFTVDNTAPASATSLAWSEGAVTNLNSITATWTPTISADATAQELQFHSNATCTSLIDSFASGPASSSYVRDVTAVTDSTFYFMVGTADSAGNISLSGCSAAIRVDHVAPMAPAVTSHASPYISNTNPITISGSCETDATVYLSGAESNSATCVSNAFSFTLTAAGDGVYTYFISQKDAATNASGNESFEWTLDTQAPTLTIGVPSVSKVSSADSVSFDVTYTGADTILLDATDITISGASAGCTPSVSGTGLTTRTVTITGCSSDGTASISVAANTAYDNAGNYALAEGPSTSFTVQNLSLVFTSWPFQPTAGGAFGVTLEVRDSNNTVNPDLDGSSVTLSLGANPGSDILNGTLTGTIGSGTVSFSGLSLEKAASGYTIIATETGGLTKTSPLFDVVPAALSTLAFSSHPTDSISAQTLGTVSVSGYDQYNNLATNSAATITLAIGQGPAGGTLAGTTSKALSSGAASFTDLTIAYVGLNYQLSASAGVGVTSAASNSFRVDPAHGHWAWMKGASSANALGVYGTQGVSDPNNAPGARRGHVTWKGSDGSLWVFGGFGYGASGSAGYLNDLWKWDPISQQWTWMDGSSAVNATSLDGYPTARQLATAQVDSTGKMWLFGGVNSSGAKLNDLWTFDGANWVQVHAGGAANYVTTDSAGVPAARHGAHSWIDSDNLWIFGGMGYLNDLWMWDGAQWIWKAGSDQTNQLGDFTNYTTPGARAYGMAWASPGYLYLFGGYGYASGSTAGNLNDLWRWDIVGGSWAFLDGASVVNDAGTTSYPASRESSAVWADANGNLWLFGGYTPSAGYVNDLWRYIPGTGWSWFSVGESISGNSRITASYGSMGIPTATNAPGARYRGSSAFYSDGTVWLFGGWGYYDSINGGYLNDLWLLRQP